MIKIITAIVNKQEKEIINEGLKIKPLKNISKVMGFRFYHLSKKKKKKQSNR